LAIGYPSFFCTCPLPIPQAAPRCLRSQSGELPPGRKIHARPRLRDRDPRGHREPKGLITGFAVTPFAGAGSRPGPMGGRFGLRRPGLAAEPYRESADDHRFSRSPRSRFLMALLRSRRNAGFEVRGRAISAARGCFYGRAPGASVRLITLRRLSQVAVVDHRGKELVLRARRRRASQRVTRRKLELPRRPPLDPWRRDGHAPSTDGRSNGRGNAVRIPLGVPLPPERAPSDLEGGRARGRAPREKNFERRSGLHHGLARCGGLARQWESSSWAASKTRPRSGGARERVRFRRKIHGRPQLFGPEHTWEAFPTDEDRVQIRKSPGPRPKTSGKSNNSVKRPPLGGAAKVRESSLPNKPQKERTPPAAIFRPIANAEGNHQLVLVEPGPGLSQRPRSNALDRRPHARKTGEQCVSRERGTASWLVASPAPAERIGGRRSVHRGRRSFSSLGVPGSVIAPLKQGRTGLKAGFHISRSKNGRAPPARGSADFFNAFAPLFQARRRGRTGKSPESSRSEARCAAARKGTLCLLFPPPTQAEPDLPIPSRTPDPGEASCREERAACS